MPSVQTICITFQERETGLRVEVETPFTWGSDRPLFHVVRYPAPGATAYVITDEQLDRHFEIVTPQSVRVRASNVWPRPTAKQRESEQAG